MHLGTTTCKITIGNKYVLRAVHEIEIKRSVHQLIQTASVKLPLSAIVRNKELLQRIKLADKIKEGDPIKLEFGYNGNHRTEFEGYIRRIGDEMPMELQCEDGLYLLRKVQYKESFKSISLKTLIEFVLRGLEQRFNVKIAVYDKIPEMSFTKFLIKEANGIEVLQELKDKYGITSFLTKINGVDTLYVGLSYSMQKGSVKYSLGRNTIGKGDLKYTGAEDKKYRVKVENFRRNGTKNVFELGETGGDEKVIRIPGDLDQKFIEMLAKKEIERLRSAGYKGGFETLLFPYCEPGMVAKIVDPQFEQRGGSYYVGTVTTTFGVNGGKRKNEIDIKVSNNG